MAKRKPKNQTIRKISKIGNYSLGVTFPISVLNSLGWKEKQKVLVKRVSRGIMIRDWPTPKRPKKKR